MTTVIIPFGKHKGKTVEETLITDPQYLQFLDQQAWAREKFPNILAAAAALSGDTSEDTPAHNALQLRFLDGEFCLEFLRTTKWWIKSVVEEDLARTQKKAEDYSDDLPEWLENELSKKKAACETPDVSFEHSSGWDVAFTLRRKYYCVELKPTLGDDFASVLRTVNRRRAAQNEMTLERSWNRNYYRTDERHVHKRTPAEAVAVLIEQWNSSASYDDVRKLYERSNVTLLRLADFWPKRRKVIRP